MSTSQTQLCKAISLARWNLTIPIDAEVIPTDKLNRGYQDPFFKQQPEFIDFIAPSDLEGVKSTPNSDYPRSELRYTLFNGDDKEANWRINSSPLHVLAGTCAIMEGAASGKLIFTQWHGDGKHPGFKGQATRQKNGKWQLFAQLRRKLNGDEDKVMLAEVDQGEAFTYRFELTETGLFKAFIGGEQIIKDVLLEEGFQFDMKSYAKDTWYPKAGVYSQEKVGGKGRGWVRYFALEAFDGLASKAPTLGLPGKPEEPETPVPTPSPGPEDEAAGIEGKLRDLLTAYLSEAIKLQPAKEELYKLSTAIKGVKEKDPKRAEELNGLARTVQQQLK